MQKSSVKSRRKTEVKSKRIISIKGLRKKLQRVFNLYIRLRDCNDDGVYRCVSCGKYGVWGGGYNAGHYFNVGSQYMCISVDEINVNGQCVHCNKDLEGNKHGYQKGLIKKYGKNVFTLLDIRRASARAWTRFEYEVMIKKYREKAKRLAKEKMFEVKI